MRAGMEKGRRAAEDGGCALPLVSVTEPMFQSASPERSASEVQPENTAEHAHQQPFSHLHTMRAEETGRACTREEWRGSGRGLDSATASVAGS